MAAPTRRTALQILAAVSIVTIPSARAASDGDERLQALVNELLAVANAEKVLVKANPHQLEADDIPGYTDLLDRHIKILDLIAEAEIVGVQGLRAKARAIEFADGQGDFEATCAIATSLADDILRLYPVEVA